MKKNILYIISGLNFGGAEKQIVADANISESSGSFQNVHFIAYMPGPLISYLNRNIKTTVIKRGGYFAEMKRLATFIRTNNIDIVHASLFAPMVIAALASIITKTKIIWHFHGHDYKLPITSKLTLKYLGRLPSVKTVLFVCTEQLNHHRIFMKFPEKKLRVIFNHTEIQTPPEKDEHHSNPISIGYLGRVIPLKRLHFLADLSAFFIEKNQHNFKIEIVGDGPDLKNIKDIVEKKGLTRYFNFHGFQTNIIDYYKKFDVFVNTSSEECLSVAMVDAAMCQLPIVAFNVGGNSEIVLSGKTGYIANSQDEFNSFCYDLLCNKGLRDEMGNKGMQYAQTTFGLKEHKKILLDFYSEIINN